MSNATVRFSGYGGHTLLAILVSVLVVGAVSFLVMSMIAVEKVDRVRIGWERDFGTWDEILERYPSRGPNAAALRLETLAVPLGIDLATRGVEGRDRPEKGSRSFRRLKGELGDYLTRQLERPDRGPDGPPPDVAAYLEAHEGDLDALRRQLSGGTPPEWERELDKLWAARVPNLLGHLDLQRVLLADALARESSGDHETALADVDAAWRLNSALRDDPTLITQLISISVTRMQAGVLRQLREVPWFWHDRLLEGHDFRESFIAALRLEAWMWTQIDDVSLLTSEESLLRQAVLRAARPYVQFCFADVSDDYREQLVNLARVRTLCDRDLEASDADLDIPIPRWNLIGRMVAPGLGGTDRLARLELDLELTRKIIELHAARRRNGGAWPTELPGIERSDVCPRDSWAYEASSGDSMSVAFSREISWTGQQGAILPMRHVSRM